MKVQITRKDSGIEVRECGEFKVEKANGLARPFTREEEIAVDTMALLVGSAIHYDSNIRFNPEFFFSLLNDAIESDGAPTKEGILQQDLL